jgi:hypothetical protein
VSFPESLSEKPDAELEKRIHANANLMLWCVHVLGPDDVHAAPSYEEADARAREFNMLAHVGGTSEHILCFAYAAPWPHGADGHAEGLKNWGERDV